MQNLVAKKNHNILDICRMNIIGLYWGDLESFIESCVNRT